MVSVFRARKYMQELMELGQDLVKDADLQAALVNAIRVLDHAVKKGNRILIFGNGGSAAEAQHFAAELVGRFQKRRRAVSAIALSTDTSVLTSQANDEGFETVFSRQIEAHCRPKDLLIGLTTSDADEASGHSVNMVRAFQAGREQGGNSIGLVSAKTKKLLPLIDIPIAVPSTDTALIQIAHLHVIHFLCLCVEENL